jgi:putative spermidine/putrescine transport system ATP-binding protein
VVEAAGGQVVVATAHGPVRAAGTIPPGAKAFVAVRPERMSLGAAAGRDNHIDLPLRDIVFQGSKVQLHFNAAQGDQVVVETAQLPDMRIEPGAGIRLSFAVADAIAFPADESS